jgi:hypothetical protein
VVEFSPKRLEFREFHIWTIPFTEFALHAEAKTRVWRPKTLNYLIERGLLHKRGGDTLWIDTTERRSSKWGPSEDLSELLKLLHDDVWIAWNEEERELSKCLWDNIDDNFSEDTSRAPVQDRLINTKRAIVAGDMAQLRTMCAD